jgi:hypothetical protein
MTRAYNTNENKPKVARKKTKFLSPLMPRRIRELLLLNGSTGIRK